MPLGPGGRPRRRPLRGRLGGPPRRRLGLSCGLPMADAMPLAVAVVLHRLEEVSMVATPAQVIKNGTQLVAVNVEVAAPEVHPQGGAGQEGPRLLVAVGGVEDGLG